MLLQRFCELLLPCPLSNVPTLGTVRLQSKMKRGCHASCKRFAMGTKFSGKILTAARNGRNLHFSSFAFCAQFTTLGCKPLATDLFATGTLFARRYWAKQCRTR
jgi:hypothetical protein